MAHGLHLPAAPVMRGATPCDASRPPPALRDAVVAKGFPEPAVKRLGIAAQPSGRLASQAAMHRIPLLPPAQPVRLAGPPFGSPWSPVHLR